ncbi:hypothetical protein BH09SUM1_BH09SUM1_22660 [soil metagenome]
MARTFRFLFVLLLLIGASSCVHDRAAKAAEKAAILKLAFVPEKGMSRAKVEEALGAPEFTGRDKAKRDFSMYPVREGSYRTVTYDAAGLVVDCYPDGSMKSDTVMMKPHAVDAAPTPTPSPTPVPDLRKAK